MIKILLNSIALDPNRWTKNKLAFYKLDKLLPAVSAAGFNYLELWQYHISKEKKDQIKKYYKIANSLGLSFPITGLYPKLQLTGKERQIELDKIKTVFEFAVLLGSEIVKIFVGNQSSSKLSEVEYNRTIEFMTEIISLAKTHGLTIAGETHQKTLFDEVESCLKYLKRVKSDNFKICYQPYDISNTTQAIRDYRLLADNVIHVHYQGRKNNKFELLKNSDLDYSKLTTELYKSNFTGFISIEFVKNCVVENPLDFNLEQVLQNAQYDRDFVLNILKNSKINVSA
jgi:3-dehydroshikimate dehydratase